VKFKIQVEIAKTTKINFGNLKKFNPIKWFFFGPFIEIKLCFGQIKGFCPYIS
jgi:hypothetical protein